MVLKFTPSPSGNNIHTMSTIQDSSDSRYDEGNIHTAASDGDMDLITSLIKSDPSVIESKESTGMSPLLTAISCHQLETAKLLVKMGAAVDSEDFQGRTSLSIASYQGWSEMVRFLLRNGAKSDTGDKHGRKPIHTVTYSSDVKTLNILLQGLSTEDVNEPDLEGMSPLHWAAFHGRPEHIQALITKGAALTVTDVDGKTPLHWAAQNGNLPSWQAIIKACSNDLTKKLIITKDRAGRTPCHLAAASGHLALLREMVSLTGSSGMNIRDNQTRNSLHWAAANGHTKCAKFLLKYVKDVDSKDSDGWTVLDYAIHTAQHDLVKLVIRQQKQGKQHSKTQIKSSIKATSHEDVKVHKKLDRSLSNHLTIDTASTQSLDRRTSNQSVPSPSNNNQDAVITLNRTKPLDFLSNLGSLFNKKRKSRRKKTVKPKGITEITEASDTTIGRSSYAAALVGGGGSKPDEEGEEWEDETNEVTDVTTNLQKLRAKDVSVGLEESSDVRNVKVMKSRGAAAGGVEKVKIKRQRKNKMNASTTVSQDRNRNPHHTNSTKGKTVRRTPSTNSDYNQRASTYSVRLSPLPPISIENEDDDDRDDVFVDVGNVKQKLRPVQRHGNPGARQYVDASVKEILSAQRTSSTSKLPPLDSGNGSSVGGGTKNAQQQVFPTPPSTGDTSKSSDSFPKLPQISSR